MSYFRKPLLGLGGVENCGPDQVWDPNLVFNNIKGMCAPRSNYNVNDLVDPTAVPTSVKDKSGSGSSSAGSIFGSIFGALTRPAATPAPMPYYPPPSAGMSTGTKIALIGGGAVILLALLANKD